jgi:hypothetical protein
MLTAGANGLRNVLWLGGSQHENHVSGRLLQDLEQGVEGRVGDLVSFVENEDLKAVAGWAIAGGLAQLTDLLDAAIGGRVDLNDIYRVSGPDLGARLAYPARLRHCMVRRAAIQSHSQDASYGGLADTPMATEYIAVCGPPLLDSILKGLGDMFLPNDLGKRLRPVFAGQNLVAHEEKD